MKKKKKTRHTHVNLRHNQVNLRIVSHTGCGRARNRVLATPGAFIELCSATLEATSLKRKRPPP